MRDCVGRGLSWEKLQRDAGLMLARRRRVERGEQRPLRNGEGLLSPGERAERGGGFHSLGVRPVVDEPGR
jgi:hypothetical protein